ncbi:MAG: PepSY-associated TM helix domain-containing protein, partial [Vicinamibacterales bacterium]|nr:PepSY-associated TM helix domain-containing protein [Vicinamibacterales bacterium]
RQRFNPEPRPVEISGPRLSDEALVEVTLDLYPDHAVEVWTSPDDPTHAVTMSVRRGGEARQQQLFDPYTGEHLGNALPGGWRLTTWMLDLHDNLLAGETGRAVNGVGAVLLTLLSVTGAIIWWPGVQSWRRSVLVDWRANWRRVNWSLHSAFGFWTLLFLFMWGFTGIYLAFPEPFAAVADYIEPLDEETFDPRVGDTVLYWFAYLHFGRFGGWSTKAAWALIGLIPPVMFVTGAVMWWNRVIRSRTL